MKPSPSHARQGVACFFSGGVDSFYSVIAHAKRITHLIFVRGFDIPIANRALAELSGGTPALGRPPIEWPRT